MDENLRVVADPKDTGAQATRLIADVAGYRRYPERDLFNGA